MRYFTREWAVGDLDPQEAERIKERYKEHIESIVPALPESLAELAMNVNLHDGIIQKARVDRLQQSVNLELLCGDHQCGYSSVSMSYGMVDFDQSDLNSLAALARDRRVELLYDEVDQAELGEYEHRLLFWPRGEVKVVFKELRLSRIPKKERTVSFAGDPYEEISAV